MPVTLLAIDDSVTMRKVLEMTLSGDDYRVVTAESAEAGLAMARTEHPALILCDLSLEPRSGYDVCQALKAQFPSVPVVIMSSRQNPYDQHRGQAARADDNIDKPFDSQHLLDKLRTLLTAAHAAAASRPAAMPHRTLIGSSPSMSRPGPVARPPIMAQPSSQARPIMAAQPASRAFASTTVREPGVMLAHHRSAPPPSVTPAPHPVMATPAPHSVAARASSAAQGAMAPKLADLGLSCEQIDAVIALSREVIEKVVWEVVPVLAETMIREEIARLTSD